ncbi:MAG: hypothetical protein GXP10_00360 [Gammaproteobacteria bacterium]|nr:hypothetical protein [Gammaproteobacteria bacterium]
MQQRSEELLREASAAYENNDWDRAKHYAQDVIDIIVHKRQQALNREHPDAPTSNSVELAIEKLSDPHRHGGGRCRLFGYRELTNLLECSATQKLKPVRLLVLGKSTLIESLFSTQAKSPLRTKEGADSQTAALFRLGISRELTAYIVGIALDNTSQKSEWTPLIGKFPACIVCIDDSAAPSEAEVRTLYAALMHTAHKHILIASSNKPVENMQKRWPFGIKQIDCSEMDQNSSSAYLARLLKESLQTPLPA